MAIKAEVVFLNSRTAQVKFARAGFTGDLVEIEKYAEYANQHGNIKAYELSYKDNNAIITFALDKNHKEFSNEN